MRQSDKPAACCQAALYFPGNIREAAELSRMAGDGRETALQASRPRSGSSNRGSRLC
ncbi:hypothetical protein [Paenibacillus physcomitrellae]|uniref:hypothetical protein n=1 Tax=Paenibacillus physcomitrellae TaxID=1619311 RepID=UPI0012FD2EAB|nr:hypothetical protein [Paenibacillus physcomitrellae]